MKVNIKTVLCATVFILFIGYNVYSSQKKGVISEMALAYNENKIFQKSIKRRRNIFLFV